MFKTVLISIIGALALPVFAQMSPVGVWKTYDEKSGELSSYVRISDTGGVLSGKIEKLVRKDVKQDAVCEKCTDSLKDKPVLGLEIISGAKKASSKDVWEGGKILDPDNGKFYSLTLTPADNGKKLNVHGFIGFALLGRTQTWVRE